VKRITLSVRQMEQLLANQQNRTLCNRWTLYHRDMVAGRFNFGLSPIVLYRDGLLADGQHRLRAAIEAGLPRTWYVVEIDRSEIVNVDTGRPRSTRDLAAVQGMKLQTTTFAAARMALWLEGGWPTRPVHSHREVIEAVTRFNVSAFPKTTKMAGFNQLVGLCAFLSVQQIDDERFMPAVHAFLDGVVIGEMLHMGDPRLTLRNRLTNATFRSSGDQQQRQILWMCVRSWNAYAQGETLGKLIVPAPIPDIYPTLEVKK
jgi:hypothetical protein